MATEQPPDHYRILLTQSANVSWEAYIATTEFDETKLQSEDFPEVKQRAIQSFPTARKDNDTGEFVFQPIASFKLVVRTNQPPLPQSILDPRRAPPDRLEGSEILRPIASVLLSPIPITSNDTFNHQIINKLEAIILELEQTVKLNTPPKWEQVSQILQRTSV